MISTDDLKSICPTTKWSVLALYVDALNAAMTEFDISTPEREAMFLAQIAHESMGFHLTKELWGPTDAQRRYEGRADLGNDCDGDGVKYKGRGLIQITGRSNYSDAAAALGYDLVNNPELLEEPTAAARSAAWFWQTHGCNELADKGDYVKITRKINGGLNGYAERQAYLTRARAVIA